MFVQKFFVLGNGKITIRILEDKLVRFLVHESQSQSSSHDFLLFDTQYLPCISTLSKFLSSNLHPETTHKSNWQHQNTVQQIQNSDLGKCKIATHCAVWPGWVQWCYAAWKGQEDFRNCYNAKFSNYKINIGNVSVCVREVASQSLPLVYKNVTFIF